MGRRKGVAGIGQEGRGVLRPTGTKKDRGEPVLQSASGEALLGLDGGRDDVLDEADAGEIGVTLGDALDE